MTPLQPPRFSFPPATTSFPNPLTANVLFLFFQFQIVLRIQGRQQMAAATDKSASRLPN